MKIKISENNSINISTTNKKLGGFILSINLPAGLTCRADAPCQKGCYAKKGNFTYNNVKNSVMGNLKAFNEEPENFFNAIIKALNNSDICYKFFRWHASGDIVNNEYLKGIVKVAKDESKNADIPEFAIPCIGKCYECKSCWSLEKGQSVVFNQH